MRRFPVVLSCALAALLCFCGVAAAQPADSRLEVGAHASFLRSSDYGTTSAGIGGRVSFDVSRWLALEAEGSFFPSDDVLLPPGTVVPAASLTYKRRRSDAFLGLKVGLRGDRFGLFARARPGLTHLADRGSGFDCVGEACPLVLLLATEYRTEFAFDLGGGFEFYPSARTVARLDLGDTIIRHRSTAPPCWGTACTSHNFSSRVGIGFRF